MESVVVMAAHDSIHLREYELSVEHQQTGEEVSHPRSHVSLPTFHTVQIVAALPDEFADTRSHKSLGAARRWW